MTKTVGIAQAKDEFSDLLNLVNRRRGRVIVSKHGKTVGALVSAQDLKRLEKMEARERVLKRVRALEKSTKKYVPLEQLVRNYEKKWGTSLDQLLNEE